MSRLLLLCCLLGAAPALRAQVQDSVRDGGTDIVAPVLFLPDTVGEAVPTADTVPEVSSVDSLSLYRAELSILSARIDSLNVVQQELRRRMRALVMLKDSLISANDIFQR